MATIVKTLVLQFYAGQTFAIPSDYASLVSIEAYGMGGTGKGLPITGGGGGGGGGGYSKITSLALTANQTCYVYTGYLSTSEPSWFSTTSSSPVNTSQGVRANGGGFATTRLGGAGASVTGAIGTTLFAGGAGGDGSNNGSQSGGGGGGSGGGPFGAGSIGGNANASTSTGGGGAGAVSRTARGVAGGNATTTAGGDGGASGTGTAGGFGATSTTAAFFGIDGGGGGGGFGNDFQYRSKGGDTYPMQRFYTDSVTGIDYGPAGGGGGGTNVGQGGTATNYTLGGGGGGGMQTSNPGSGSSGAIVFTYNATVPDNTGFFSIF